jgi:23S rRNA pseudouridine955/2504/2580 synthase
MVINEIRNGDTLTVIPEDRLDTISSPELDAFLKKNAPQLDDAALRSVFQHRDVKVNGIRVKPADRLLAHQSVQVYFMEYQEREPLDVVYEDADVLLINKRAGISVEEDDAGGVTVSQ